MSIFPWSMISSISYVGLEHFTRRTWLGLTRAARHTAFAISTVHNHRMAQWEGGIGVAACA
jgi:hypothetical protein